MAFTEDLEAQRQLLTEQLKAIDQDYATRNDELGKLTTKRTAIVKLLDGIGRAQQAAGELDRIDPPGPTKIQPPMAKPVYTHFTPREAPKED